MAYNAQQIMADIQGSNMNNMRNLIIKAQNNPRSLSEQELALAMQYGQQLGIDMSPAMKRDKASTVENLGAGLMGGLDAMAFGLIPDDWYSSYRTKRAKNIGKTFGTVLSLALPGIGALKGSKQLIGMAKGLQGTVKGAMGAKVAGTAGKSILDKSIGELVKGTGVGMKGLMELGSKIGTTALSKAKDLTSREILEMAKALVQVTSLPSNVSGAINPMADTSQLNPYTQTMGIGGMPEMQ